MISEISGKLEKYNLEITNIDKKATDTNKGMELKAVSYTHLDVYKRQIK